MTATGRFFFFAVSLSLVSCDTESNRWGAEKWDTVSVTHLHGNKIAIDRTVLTEDELIFHDEYVIFRNMDGLRQFSVFKASADSLAFEGSFFTLGRGPNEALAAELFHLQEDNLLSVVGYNPRGKSFFISLDNISNCMDIHTWRKSEYDYVSSYAFDMIPINDSTYLMQTFDEDDQLFKVLNVNSKSVTPTGIAYPRDNNDNLSLSNKSMLYYGDVRKRPHENRFIYSNQSSKYSFIFTLDGNGLKETGAEMVIFSQTPDAYVDGDRLIYTNNCESGYQLSVSHNYIYFADPKINNKYRDKSISKNGYPPGYVTEIYVSDWEGNPRCKYVLDRPVCYLQPNVDDTFLWAFFLNPDTLEPEIVRYALPKI